MAAAENPIGWRRLGWWAVVFTVLLLALYHRTLVHLVGQWWDEPEYSHGFLVPLFTGYLVWQQRARLTTLTPNGTWWGLVVVSAAIAGLILGNLGAELFLARTSFILMLAGLVLLHLGPGFFRVMAFPLGFLFFMVPLPSVVYFAITFPLQRLAAACAAAVIGLLRIPVLLDGNIIHLAELSLGVAEACSGIRSLISLLCVATGWAWFTLPRVWPRLLLVASAVPVAIAANIVRVIATALVVEWVDVRFAEGFYHEVSGWLAFAFAFVCLAAVQSLIERGSTR